MPLPPTFLPPPSLLPSFSRLRRPSPQPAPPTSCAAIEILAQTATWIAINKPANTLVHRTNLHATATMEPNVTDMLRHQLPPNTPSPNPVHRLDRPTSGPLLFSLGPPPVTAALQAALASAEARKQYWVLAFGANMPSQWRNDHALSDMSANRNRNRNRNRATKQRPASSEFELLHAFEQSNICVVRATISTGRRHQIRRHLSNSKYPVVGDTTHGKGPLNRDARQNHGVTRCCLHARRLSFRDPQSDSMVHLQVPVPADLQAVLQTFPDYNCELHDPHLDLGNT